MPHKDDDITAEVAPAGAGNTVKTRAEVRRRTIPQVLVDRPPLTIATFLGGIVRVAVAAAIMFFVLFLFVHLNRAETIGRLESDVNEIGQEQKALDEGVSSGAVTVSDARTAQLDLTTKLAVRNRILAEMNSPRRLLDTPYLKALVVISLGAGLVFGLCWGRTKSPRHGTTEIELRPSPIRRRRVSRTTMMVPRGGA